MSEAVTSCPACSASFRVTEQQLLVVEGSVRCGVCLHLFQAEDYLISPMLDVTELLVIESDYWTDFEVYIKQALGPAWDHVEINPVSTWGPEETDSLSVFLEDEMLGPGETIDLDVADDPDLIFKDRRYEFAVSSLKWLPGILIMLVLVFVQFAYLRMEQFAQELGYRPYYETACHYLGCTLPEFHDPSLLQARELVIRSHPTEQDALIADVLLSNSAEYRQLFPDLHLRFFDINGNIVAGRVFRVSEYLSGEMRGLKFIPGHTEVRLSLEIVDPGEEALGYQMDVVSSGLPN